MVSVSNGAASFVCTAGAQNPGSGVRTPGLHVLHAPEQSTPVATHGLHAVAFWPEKVPFTHCTQFGLPRGANFPLSHA